MIGNYNLVNRKSDFHFASEEEKIFFKISKKCLHYSKRYDNISEVAREKSKATNIGAWLSLVERSVRDREVAGSNPVAPIRKRRNTSLSHVSVAQLDRATAF